MIETADDRGNHGIWQKMLGQTGQNAKLLAGWASNGITMRLLSTEYVCCLSQEAVALRLHAQSNFLARADCSEMRLLIGARRAPSEGYRDSDLVQSPFRDALIASTRHFPYWHFSDTARCPI